MAFFKVQAPVTVENKGMRFATGTFVASASANTTINVGFRPKYIMYRRVTVSDGLTYHNGSTYIYDSDRGAESTATTSSTASSATITTTYRGFTSTYEITIQSITDTGFTVYKGNTNTYRYWAIGDW